MSDQRTPRIDLTATAGAPFAAMLRLEERIVFDPTIRNLVKVRASQVNGCAYCIDMHWTVAREKGESELRLAQLSAWHESASFDQRERAALALTDAVTAVAETHVPDDVWAVAAEAFDQEELGHLLFAIGAINLWNRVVVSARTVPVNAPARDVATPASST